MKNNFANQLLAECKGKKVAIMGHKSADFDCIGSCVGMHLILKQNKIKSDILVENDLNAVFYNIADRITYYSQPKQNYDVCIMVDCPTFSQIPDNVVGAFTNAKTTYVIDHHITNSKYAKYNFVKQASSACEVIFDLFEDKIKLNPQLAQALYIGIYTDSGGFKYSNTTSHTYEVLAKLTKQKCAFDKLVHDCVDEVELTTFELTKTAFLSVEFYYNKQIAVSVIKKEDLDRLKVEHSGPKFMQSYLQNIKGVKVAICITERVKNEYNISLRTACDNINVSAIAQHFGGGGHIRASGLTLKGEYKKALNALVNECKKSIKGINNW